MNEESQKNIAKSNEKGQRLEEDKLRERAEFFVENRKELHDKEQNFIELSYDNELSKIALLEKTEEEKTKLVLEAERKRLEAILALAEKYPELYPAIELDTLRNAIKSIKNEIDGLGADVQVGGQDLYELAGINLSDEKKDAIATSTDFAIGQVQNFLRAKIDAANAAVAASDEEVSAAQSRLDAEVEARNNGYANSVQSAQKELALAKKVQDKALKEQEKAQKAEAAIQTLQQIGSLVTASAKIWGQLGFPWAIPAIAVMFGSFAFAKVKASQVSKQQYGDGGMEFLDYGGSHASGNDIGIGTTKSGKSRTAERGEALAIINKSKTRKYRKILPDVIKSLNKGEFESKFGNSYGMDGMSLMVPGGSDLGKLERDVNRIKEQGERRYYTDGKGRVVETYKNLKRVYNAN